MNGVSRYERGEYFKIELGFEQRPRDWKNDCLKGFGYAYKGRIVMDKMCVCDQAALELHGVRQCHFAEVSRLGLPYMGSPEDLGKCALF